MSIWKPDASWIYRHKTEHGFVIPIYPQDCAAGRKTLQRKKHHERLFTINQARKALTNACKRWSFPNFTQRSLRRMFITRCNRGGELTSK